MIFSLWHLKVIYITFQNSTQRFFQFYCASYRLLVYNCRFFTISSKMVKIYNITKTYFFGNASISLIIKISMSSLRHLKDKSIFFNNITHKVFSTILCTLQVTRNSLKRSNNLHLSVCSLIPITYIITLWP